ncbi:MAG TPA: choice-of-anchor J domain-containing protein [Flavipsychrobacter sp.]|nr:choice-of-anchor J domain-containing protein [Flavipsychrobacter sp.]
MKKVLLSCGIASLLLTSMDASAQLALQNFNAPTWPATWLRYNQDGLTPHSSVAFVNNAWVLRTRNQQQGDSCIVSTSYYNPAGTANDWVVSPQFMVNGTNCFLRWEEYTPDVNFPDGYQVLLSPTGGSAVTDFTVTLLTVTAANTNEFLTKVANLGAYNGSNVRIAFRNNSNDKFLLYLDNIETVVLPPNAISLNTVTPTPGSPTAYGLAGNTVTIGGTVQNLGATNITGYTVTYQQGANPPQVYNVTGANIVPYGTGNFTHNIPYTLPATPAEYPINVWVTLTGDADNTDDSIMTSAGSAAFMPDKKLTFEEATGTWCGWCPRGSAWMDSVSEVYGNDLTLIAVHNSDPMEQFSASTQAYDAKIGNYIGGYPSMVVDRRFETDPSNTFAVYNAQSNYFGFADITIGTVTTGTNSVTVPVTVKPAIPLSGDYRLALVITEEGAKGTTSGWAQVNYYSSTSQNQNLFQDGINWKNLPNPVPAANIMYDFVARYISDVDGNPGSLPASMSASTDYTYSFSNVSTTGMGPLSHLRVNVLLIRNSDGQVLNSNNVIVPTGVANVNKTISGVSLYPNPTNDRAILAFTLQNAGKANVTITDAVGRVVYSNAQQFGAGEQILNIETADMVAGIYNVKIETTEGSVTERLTVVK